MKLKDKILSKAVQLFNEKGIAATSPNQISTALNISTGNLTYHFKTKADLVKAVYVKMVEDSKDFLKIDGYVTLDHFRRIMGRFLDFKKKYTFFFHDLTFIIRNYPEAGKLIEKSNLERFQQARILFKHYIDTDRMIPESAGINYDFLTHNIWTVAAFWDVLDKIIPASHISQKKMDMVDMTWYMILPYLTQKGKDEYTQINKYLNTNRSILY